ncbi:MAG: hypothetical protein RI953_2963 [Pseudomonadota bacterium]
MNGTRMSTMAAILLTASAPSAFAIVSNPSEEKVVRTTSAQESFQSWRIPAPGQTLGRVASGNPKLESVGSLGMVTTVDSVTQEPKARFGQLPLNLAALFGGEGKLNRWLKSAQSSSSARQSFASHLEKHLRHFAAQNASELSLTGLTLNWDAKRFYVDGQHVFASFYLAAAGTIIEGAEVTFRFNEGQLTNIVGKTFGAEKAGLTGFKAPTSRALAAARAVLGPSAELKAETVHQRYVPRVDGNRYVLEPAVSFDANSATGETFTIVAHVSNNEILSWNANTIYFDAQINGVVNQRTPRGPQSTVGMPYAQATTRAGWFGRSNTYNANADGVVQIPDRQAARATLSSARFKVVNNGGQSASIPVDGDVLFDARSNSTLAENTTFYHLAVAQAWARPVINPSWFSTQVVANVNMNDICNAFWNGRTVNFFKAGERSMSNGKTVSCANTGEIADVVYHEWGHGLHHNTGGIRDRAFSEGIGDTVAQLITGSADVGPGFFADGRPVRNLDGDYMYPPKDNEREVHKEGLIFGSAYFHLTQALVAKYGNEVGRATARQWFLKMLYTASQYTDTYEALLALDSEPSRMDVRGPNYCIINGAYSRHGLANKDSSCK